MRLSSSSKADRVIIHQVKDSATQFVRINSSVRCPVPGQQQQWLNECSVGVAIKWTRTRTRTIENVWLLGTLLLLLRTAIQLSSHKCSGSGGDWENEMEWSVEWNSWSRFMRPRSLYVDGMDTRRRLSFIHRPGFPLWVIFYPNVSRTRRCGWSNNWM